MEIAMTEMEIGHGRTVSLYRMWHFGVHFVFEVRLREIALLYIRPIVTIRTWNLIFFFRFRPSSAKSLYAQKKYSMATVRNL